MSRLFCIENFPCSGSCRYKFKAGVEVWMENNVNRFIGVELILAHLGMPKEDWPSMNWYRMLFIQTPTPAPNMHLQLTQHGKFYMQANQLLAKTAVGSRITLLLLICHLKMHCSLRFLHSKLVCFIGNIFIVYWATIFISKLFWILDASYAIFWKVCIYFKGDGS